MSAAELSKYIGREGDLSTNEILVRVRVEDAKSAYGRTRFLVKPCAGSGTVWVDAERVQLLKASAK